MKREFYSDSIANFLKSSTEQIVGKLALGNNFPLEQSQRDAWIEEIRILRKVLVSHDGAIHFEYSIPRMGERIDVVLLIGPVIFVLEFKIGEKDFTSYALDQVTDYALDLKNFHEPSHDRLVAPILIATKIKDAQPVIVLTPQNDKILFPIRTNVEQLSEVIGNVLQFADGVSIDWLQWASGRYCPTPTIMEAALALYNGHSVAEISRNDATAINLSRTSESISEVINFSREKSLKSICFVTGVPGAGKTLVGLNVANTHIDKKDKLYSVFLSGNGPLVAILREALARDKVKRTKTLGKKIKKGEAMGQVKAFIQNVNRTPSQGRG